MKSLIAPDIWETKRELITKLYKDEEWPLKQVIKLVQTRDFHPSESQLRSRLKKWHITKPSRKKYTGHKKAAQRSEHSNSPVSHSSMLCSPTEPSLLSQSWRPPRSDSGESDFLSLDGHTETSISPVDMDVTNSPFQHYVMPATPETKEYLPSSQLDNDNALMFKSSLPDGALSTSSTYNIDDFLSLPAANYDSNDSFLLYTQFLNPQDCLNEKPSDLPWDWSNNQQLAAPAPAPFNLAQQQQQSPSHATNTSNTKPTSNPANIGSTSDKRETAPSTHTQPGVPLLKQPTPTTARKRSRSPPFVPDVASAFLKDGLSIRGHHTPLWLYPLDGHPHSSLPYTDVPCFYPITFPEIIPSSS